MQNKLKVALVSLASLVVFGAGSVGAALYVAPNVAAQSFLASAQGAACNGVNQLGGPGCGSNPGASVSHLMKVALDILSILAGFITVVMVIVSGIKFITANGDASSISSARQSLIYALAGIVVVAMAQIIVRFVIGKVVQGN